MDALLSEASLGNPEITTVGIELDGLVANLLTALGATVPTEFTVYQLGLSRRSRPPLGRTALGP